MKKRIGIALLAVLAIAIGAGAMITPAQAKADKNCDWLCRQTYFWYCCGGPDEEPGCVIIGRCE